MIDFFADPYSLDTNKIISFPKAQKRASLCAISDTIPLQLLYSAYFQGIFPWFCEDDGEPVCWHSPNPRFCIQAEKFHIPSRLKRTLKSVPFSYTMDTCFDRVMDECRTMTRKGQSGTWIGQKMKDAYFAFYKKGFAHSVEVWNDKNLVGGLYGVLIGSVFFGESMFTIESESSKCAFVHFAKAFISSGGGLIDSQVYTENIARYGAQNISRDAYLYLLKPLLRKPLSLDIHEAFEKEVFV